MSAAATPDKRALLEQVGQLEVRVRLFPLDHLLDRVTGGSRAAEAFDRHRAVNYIRETLCDYDRALAAAASRAGGAAATSAINRKIYRAIAKAYPFLASECRQRLEDAHPTLVV